MPVTRLKQFLDECGVSYEVITHAPAYVAPVAAPCPVVLTVHDLHVFTHPQYCTFANRLHYRLLLPLVLVTLMKGVTYAESDPPLWQALLAVQARVREHVALLGLELILDEAESILRGAGIPCGRVRGRVRGPPRGSSRAPPARWDREALPRCSGAALRRSRDPLRGDPRPGRGEWGGKEHDL